MNTFDQILSSILPLAWGLTILFFIGSWVCYRKLLPSWLKNVGAFTSLVYLFYVLATLARSLEMMMYLALFSTVVIALELLIGLVSAVIIFKTGELKHKGASIAGSFVFYSCNILMLFWPVVFTGAILSAI